jgi:hypothetical protein
MLWPPNTNNDHEEEGTPASSLVALEGDAPSRSGLGWCFGSHIDFVCEKQADNMTI